MEPEKRARIVDSVTAHHPDHPAFEEDVYRVAGRRFCIGCFTTLPLFMVTVAALLYAPVPGSWSTWVVVGLGLAALQGVSSAGLARRRWVKAGVKAALGIGLAFVVVGVLTSGWSPWFQGGVLLGVLGLAGLSALPRTIRMRRAVRSGP